MPTWVATLLYVGAGSFLFLWVSYAVACVVFDAKVTRETKTKSAMMNDPFVTLFAPGILSPGHKAMLDLNDEDGPTSVMATLLRHGDVTTFAYEGKRFSHSRAVRQAVDAICSSFQVRGTAEQPAQVVLFGASMGGQVFHDALRHITDLDQRGRIHLVLMDTPSGSRDLGLGGNIAAPVLRWIPLLRGMLLGSLPARSSPPKDEEIQDDLDKERVKEVANRRLSGFPFRIWAEQLVQLGRFRPNVESLDGLGSVHYMKCTLGNETVKQPQAARNWAVQDFDCSFQVYDVAMPHCGWLQYPSEMQRVLEEVYAKILARV